MIRVCCNNRSIGYSAYHLVKAFLPDEEVRQESGADQAVGEYLLITKEPEEQLIDLKTEKLDKAETDRKVYDALSALTGRTLPWGVLTGVRPVKLARSRLGEDAISWLMNERRVSESKAALATEIAKREQDLIRGVFSGADKDPDSYSLYVGIPICPSICSYCSFSSGALSVWRDRLDEYIDALTGELTLISERLKGLNLTSVYIGGGTPTVLNETQLEKLLVCLDERYAAGNGREYTLEAGRPDTITEAKLKIARDHGVNRLSINPQSMQQKTLDLIGRGHTTEQIATSFHMARDLGFDNINMDIIAGLPGEDTDDMQSTLKRIAELRPNCLTVHVLALKRAAKMQKLCADPGTVDAMVNMAADAAAGMGMIPYYLYRQKSIAGNHENTGYALPGKESIYNIMIMEEVQTIVACGAGATTKVLTAAPVQNPDRADGVMTELLRQDNVSSIADYISRYSEMAEIKEKTFVIANAPCDYT